MIRYDIESARTAKPQSPVSIFDEEPQPVPAYEGSFSTSTRVHRRFAASGNSYGFDVRLSIPSYDPPSLGPFVPALSLRGTFRSFLNALHQRIPSEPPFHLAPKISSITAASINLAPYDEATQSQTSGTDIVAWFIIAFAAASAFDAHSRAQLLARFAPYTQPDWDGYGAEPIRMDTIDATHAFLQMLPKNLGDPNMAPGADGIIALEWVFRDGPLRKLFIDIGPGSVWSAYYRRANGEKQTFPHQKIGNDTRSLLAKLFHDLSV